MVRKQISEYIKFSEISTKFAKKYGRSKDIAIKVIEECLTQNVLKDFIGEHKKEVIGIMDVLYDEKVVMESYEKELKDEGRAEGSLSIVLNMYKQKLINLATAAGVLNMSESEFLKLVK